MKSCPQIKMSGLFFFTCYAEIVLITVYKWGLQCHLYVSTAQVRQLNVTQKYEKPSAWLSLSRLAWTFSSTVPFVWVGIPEK